MSHVIRQNPARTWADISIVLVDDRGMRAVHRTYLSGNVSTDVMAFVFDPLPGESADLYAEIFVNVRRAMEIGQRVRQPGDVPGVALPRMWTASRELALYLAHGCDHIGGATDNNAAECARMRRRELRWLRDPVLKVVANRLVS